MNRALLHIAALALPLIGLGGMWVQADRLSRQGTEWDVPIQGYDPRDLLQGHYVQFQYDWPGLDGDMSGLEGGDLCIEGKAPAIARVVPAANGSNEACPNFVSGQAPGHEFLEGSVGGRLYASQAEALRLQDELMDPAKQGVVRVRLRPDGHITPLRITFRPRPPEPEAATTPAP